MNKSLEIPIVPQRIAVISSDTAAGFEDFSDQLLKNLSNYYFDLQLFPAVMQGTGAEASIIAALEKIFNRIPSSPFCENILDSDSIYISLICALSFFAIIFSSLVIFFLPSPIAFSIFLIAPTN